MACCGDRNQSVRCESDAAVTLSPNIEIKGEMSGGVLSGLARSGPESCRSVVASVCVSLPPKRVKASRSVLNVLDTTAATPLCYLSMVGSSDRGGTS